MHAVRAIAARAPWETGLGLAAAVGLGGVLALAIGQGVKFGVGAAFVLFGGLICAANISRVPRYFLIGLSVILTGYAFFGRGFAYVGAPPIFVSELVVLLATLTIYLLLPRARLTRFHPLLFAMVIWGALRTVPYVSRYGIDALRDAALWYYALVAIALSVTLRERHIEQLVGLYRRLLPIFIVWVPIAWVAYQFRRASIPRTPFSEVPFVYFKGGDMGVHLAGAGAFMLTGLYIARRGPAGRASWPLWLVWFLGLALLGTYNRGGLLAAAVGIALVVVLYPTMRVLPFVTVALFLIVSFALFSPALDLGKSRDVSLSQLSDNLMSVVSSDDSSQRLDATRQWRLDWWTAIVDYTFFGDYFWTGKGYGVNLAIDDGFVVDEGLRSPHNGHMTILARGGVPGLAIWASIQGLFAWGLVRSFRRARTVGDQQWARTFCWLLVYWIAMMLNAAVDVYLEGPQGGIWFWSVIGIGVASMRLYETRRADALERVPVTRARASERAYSVGS